jgi:transcriptional regulator with XRE-family HTH domain
VPTTPSATPTPAAPPVHSVIDLWLGEQLRHRRKALKLSLQQVAERCCISVSLLSQIERGLRSISLRTLGTLAACLDLPLDTLVRNTQHGAREAEGTVVRAGKHQTVSLHGRGIVKDNLTPPASSGQVQLFRAVIEPGGSTGDGLFSTSAGEQIGYVVEGQIELFIENRLLMLHAGDSFCYDSSKPRRWRNPGTTFTTIVWGITVKSG